MKRITTKRTFNWNGFFTDKGQKWRDKDYQYLNNNYPLDTLEGTLIDVGCGVGDGLRYLKKQCFKLTQLAGMDFSKKAIELNKNNSEMNSCGFFYHNIEEPFDKCFDNVICLQTLEHLENPLLGLKNLIKMTRKILIVSTPYKNARPDSDHMWSLNEDDFREEMDNYFIGDNNLNIYWTKKIRDCG